MSRQRRFDDAEMDITPMIDITFLLLIFFLVASKMDSGVALKLPEARNGGAVTLEHSAIISLKAGAAGRAVVYKGAILTPEHQVAATDLDAQERELADFIRQEFAQGAEQVLLRAERTVHHRDVYRIMSAVRTSEDAPIYVAVLESS